ncbi:MAG: hypothetical protein DME26_16115, partial [Verrucomicrobia bacterium]
MKKILILTAAFGDGHNTAARNIRDALEHICDDVKVEVLVLGWTNPMPQLMLSNHLVIGKAGGATVQEAIAARCPMIVNSRQSRRGHYALPRSGCRPGGQTRLRHRAGAGRSSGGYFA